MRRLLGFFALLAITNQYKLMFFNENIQPLAGLSASFSLFQP